MIIRNLVFKETVHWFQCYLIDCANSLSYLLLSPSGAVLAVTTVPSENCGIVGVVGGDDAVGFLLEGLTILRNRGYDSAGVASVGVNIGADPAAGTQLLVTKYASRDSTCDSIDLVRAHSARHAGDTATNSRRVHLTFCPLVSPCMLLCIVWQSRCSECENSSTRHLASTF